AWILTDLALLSLGAVHVPLHRSLSTQQAAELLQRSAATLLVTSKSEAELPQSDTPCVTHDQLTSGDAGPRDTQVQPNDLATILYTSGTTGQPRGVMLSHRNLVANATATTVAVGASDDETRLCFLPLSHIYARTCDLYSWLYGGTRLVLAESRETIVRDCQLAQPTVLNGVPYFYQKLAQQLQAAGETGKRGAIQKLLSGNLKRCFCGGAAVAPEVESLFAEQGLPLLSGYGLTEASPVVSAASLENYCPGTVGRPLENLEVKLAGDGEVLVRGPSVMLGYWQDEAATAATIVDGWLHTGDQGEIDAAGNLRIVGRKKEIIVLSTGKNVAPVSVEQLLTGSPLVEYACVVGDGQKCLAALIVPNPDALRAEIRRRRLWVWSKRRAVTHPTVRALYRAEIDRLLRAVSDHEQVGPFTILPRAFSIERGELTPKLSLCRRQIAANFAGQIDRMYRQLAARR
ncbi:MAG: long-chain fatty acid--CoA ligase, partial [Planctomycetes bacterium]|nr:long-chain fatty acid--CoA ligase [Planctomycetota bacterium]